jgi:hypothetical protein
MSMCIFPGCACITVAVIGRGSLLRLALQPIGGRHALTYDRGDLCVLLVVVAGVIFVEGGAHLGPWHAYIPRGRTHWVSNPRPIVY